MPDEQRPIAKYVQPQIETGDDFFGRHPEEIYNSCFPGRVPIPTLRLQPPTEGPALAHSDHRSQDPYQLSLFRDENDLR